MKQTLMAIAAMALLAACQVNYQKTKSGLPYKIFPGKGNGAQVKPGSFVKFNVKYAMPEKDTILNNTYDKVAVYTPVDTSGRVKYSFMEIMPMLKEGDSVEFALSVDSLKNMGALPDYNATFKRGDQIKCTMSIIKVFSNEDAVRQDYEKEMASEKDREVAKLSAYLQKKGVKAQQTKEGVFVVLDNPGDQSVKADTGKLITVMYKGYLQEGGKVFDTNMDTSKGHNEPYQLVLNRDPVIKGWEEALPYFGKGGKGTIYIPAMLGYGPQGSQGEIPPFANLVFDIEVKDVQTAPPAKPKADNPYGLTPEQMQQLQQQMQQQRGQQGQGH